jgi:uncharacterized protein (UPF0335 family)
MNSLLAEAQPASNATAGQLCTIVERIERLEEQRRGIGASINDVFYEAEANGFDASAIRAIVRLRKQGQAKPQGSEAILDLYEAVVGIAESVIRKTGRRFSLATNAAGICPEIMLTQETGAG